MRGALAAVLLVVAGCGAPDVRTATGHATRSFRFEPQAGIEARERAPLEGLGDARTVLTDIVTDKQTHRQLQRKNRGQPVELEVVAPTVTATEAYLTRPPEHPSTAAIRVVPEKLGVVPAAADALTLTIDYAWGSATIPPKEGEPFEPEPAFGEVLRAFLEQRGRGWRVADLSPRLR